MLLSHCLCVVCFKCDPTLWLVFCYVMPFTHRIVKTFEKNLAHPSWSVSEDGILLSHYSATLKSHIHFH
jgi:hypothetical protein